MDEAKKEANRRVIAGLEKAIAFDRRLARERAIEDMATKEHDEHDDGYDINPDPACRLCREDGFLD